MKVQYQSLTLAFSQLPRKQRKYIGDAIMIFFGDPQSKGTKEDAIACVTMALEMKKKLRKLKKDWERTGLSESLDVRMGIHTDVCTVGNFGSSDRLDYTVLGNGVNLASRLESMAEANQILISENTHNLINENIESQFFTQYSGTERPSQPSKVRFNEFRGKRIVLNRKTTTINHQNHLRSLTQKQNLTSRLRHLLERHQKALHFSADSPQLLL